MLRHLHAQEMLWGRIDVGMGQAGRPWPTGPSPFLLGSVTPLHTWIVLPFFTLAPSLASFGDIILAFKIDGFLT
jgi:hypothetical protein